MIDDKKAILAALMPRAVLKAMTPEAERASPNGLIEDGMIGIRRFPFKVGRESRGATFDGKFIRSERPKIGDARPNNDLYLVDPQTPLQISREHFQIEQTAFGYALVDRGSSCGTTVGANRVGGNHTGGSAPISDGDTIGMGTHTTPYVFTFITLP